MNIMNAPWLGTILGVLGIGFALYQIFKTRGPKLSAQYLGQTLIEGDSSDLPGGLKIVFEDRVLTNLSLSQVVIWNSGSASVRGVDIVGQDPLLITFGDNAQIIKVDVAKMTRPSIDVRPAFDHTKPTAVLIEFEFLDQRDGALLKIWHTSLETVPNFSGTVVGVPKGIENRGRMFPRYSAKAARRAGGDAFRSSAITMTSLLYSRPLVPSILVTVFGLAGLGWVLGAPILGFFPLASELWWPVLVIAAGYTALGLAGILTLRRRYPGTIAPDELGADLIVPSEG